MSDVADWLEGMSEKSPAAALAAQMIRSQDPEANIQELFGQAKEMVDSVPDDELFPDRPKHQDFALLSRIIQEMDARGEEQNQDGEMGSVVDSLVPSEADFQSVIYMARQRALRAEELLDEATAYEKMALLWFDAFTAGVKFGQAKSPTIEQLLDQSIDGNHRSGRTRG